MGRGTVNPMRVAGNSDCSSDLVLEEDVEIKLVFTGQMFWAKINKKLAALQIVVEKKIIGINGYFEYSLSTIIYS